MAKRVKKKDIEEIIALCLKKIFPEDGINIEYIRKKLVFDSIYISMPLSGKYTKWDIMKFNRYLRRYAGKNLICRFWDKEKNELIIQNEYDVIDG